MKPDDPHADVDRTSRFERELGELLLESFSRGVTIEDTWTVTVPVADAPDWIVHIEKTYSDADPPYEPELLEE